MSPHTPSRDMKRFHTSGLLRHASVFLLGTILAVGCGGVAPESEEAASDAHQSGEVSVVASSVEVMRPAACETYSNCHNCVDYADCRVPKLRNYSLTTWAQKTGIINTHTPKEGCAAIIKLTGGDAKYGHIAYVAKVSGNQITIDEGNWNHNCNTRANTAGGLDIVGYYCP